MRHSHSMLLKCWIVLCTILVASGWLLSAAGQLRAVAYAVIAGLAFLAAGAAARSSRIRWGRALGRFQRPLPLTFGLTWLVALLGGMLHAPNNYDALSYRMPRILDWLGAGRWNWIETTSQRMNYSAANAEWLSAPLLVLTHSDRLLFLLNLVPYLLLPGLIFSVYRQLGVGGRVAWAWMWVLPAAFCFALQAASIGNDLAGAVLVLASLYFSLRARRSGMISEAWLALLAMALATGVKGSNLPLVLPALVGLWPVRRMLWRRPIASGGIVAVALLISYLPTAVLNRHFTGDWRGDPRNTEALQVGSPLAGILGNVMQLGAGNLQPPVLPGASAVDRRLAALMPAQLEKFLKREFPRFEPQLGELPQEETTGLGLPLVLFLGFSLGGRLLRGRSPGTSTAGGNGIARLVPWATGAALVAYMAMIGSEAPARLLSPYYLLLLPPVLRGPGNDRWVRQGWWRASAQVAIGSTIVVLALTPARPLWPAQTILAKLQSQWPDSVQLARAREVYSVYRERNDVLHELRECLPADATRIGVVADDNDSDYALWRPFGVRTVHYLVGARRWEQETQSLTWIVGKVSLLNPRYGSSLEQLRRSSAGQIINAKSITSKVSRGPEQWFVMRLPQEPERHATVAPPFDKDR